MPLTKPYSFGPYNKFNDLEQWIRITEGCPNHCPYCYEPQKFKVYRIPKIIRNKVKIMDMNLLCKPEAIEIIKELGKKIINEKVVYYELICGIDYRFLTPQIAYLLKEAHFYRIRLAWDWFFVSQYKIKAAIEMLQDAGYRNQDLMIFMICNWRIPYKENIRKMDLCKVWRIPISDCWFDNQVSPNIKPIHWTDQEIKDFRTKVRKHNQIVKFGCDPEIKHEADRQILIEHFIK